jgi:malonyl CoA-acyl carrier protein transacylase
VRVARAPDTVARLMLVVVRFALVVASAPERIFTVLVRVASDPEIVATVDERDETVPERVETVVLVVARPAFVVASAPERVA